MKPPIADHTCDDLATSKPITSGKYTICGRPAQWAVVTGDGRVYLCDIHVRRFSAAGYKILAAEDMPCR